MTSRRVLLTFAAALVAIGIQACFHSPSYAVTRISASIDFYDELSPYGSWERVSRYGECWVPLDRPVGWRPYTVGYWVDTDYGWLWISEDPWGGIPYHYGRWAYDRYYGWVWVPGDDEVWAPAWVAWRYGDDYVGWAPLPPDAGWGGSGLTVSVSILDRRINRYGWCFTPVRSFGTTRIRSSVLPPSRNVTLLARTRNVTQYGVYNSLPAERGLRPEMIERAAGRKFQRYQVVDSRSPAALRNVAIRGRTIEAYRPRVTGVKERVARPAGRGETGPSRAVIQRQESEQRRFDQRMRQERGVLEREQRREQNQPGRSRMRQDQVRQQQQAEMQAQREREAQERRSLDQRRKIVDQMQRNEGQGRGRERGQAPDQGKGQGQAPDQGRGRGQGKAPEAKAPDQGKKAPDQGKGQDQGNGQTQDDQDKTHGRGRGRGGN
jgi:hypothetical protein